MCQPNSLNPGSIQWTWEGLLNERTDVFRAVAAFISLHPVHYTTKGCQWELVGSSIRETWWGQKIAEARALWNFLNWCGSRQERAPLRGQSVSKLQNGLWSHGLNSGTYLVPLPDTHILGEPREECSHVPDDSLPIVQSVGLLSRCWVSCSLWAHSVTTPLLRASLWPMDPEWMRCVSLRGRNMKPGECHTIFFTMLTGSIPDAS